MNIAWFKDLEQLAFFGNFSQAARNRNISQPAFSRRIKALENWVGASLVERGKHPVTLTPAGQQFLDASLQALERLEYERRQIIQAQTLPDKYVVTFGAQHSIGWRFFPAWIQAFERAYEPIISRLRADDLPNCLAALDKGEIDFVIAYESAWTREPVAGVNPDSVVIGSDLLVPVCKADQEQKPIFDFSDHNGPAIPWLRFGEMAPITRHLDPLLDKFDLKRRMSVVYENTMAGALRIRARDGAGVAWLPKSLVEPDIEAGFLSITGAPDWQVELEIVLIRRQEHSNSVTRKLWTLLTTGEQIPLLEKF